MPVPVRAPPLGFAHHVPHGGAAWRARGGEVLGPRREVSQVEVQVERLREHVRVHVVVREQVVASERAERCHRGRASAGRQRSP